MAVYVQVEEEEEMLHKQVVVVEAAGLDKLVLECKPAEEVI